MGSNRRHTPRDGNGTYTGCASGKMSYESRADASQAAKRINKMNPNPHECKAYACRLDSCDQWHIGHDRPVELRARVKRR